MKHRVMNITEFRAKCLALITEVHEHGGTVTVTRRGEPIGILRGIRDTPESKVQERPKAQRRSK